jgi:threonine/homoserine/homoserine lactone efflux protein
VLGTHSLGVFAATVLVVNATPGVDMMLVATRTLRHGALGGIAAALGVAAGCIVHTLLAAFGLAALLAASGAAFAGHAFDHAAKLQ